MGRVRIMAFGIEDLFAPDLLRALQVGVSAFILGTVLIAFHKIIKKYNLESK